jgi:8-oxo-dGTP pyrophosphatase MutT (NUDIX family)
MNDTPSRHPYLDQLDGAARERRWTNIRPRDAATLIVIDRSAKVPKLLMGKRHHGHKFMPGKFVFPGGGIEKHDRQMVVAGALDPMVEHRLMLRMQRPTFSRARALALAAIRETFEETGLVIGSKDYGTPDHAPEGPWADYAKLGAFPHLEDLHMIARAITPPKRPKRFDARFFAVDHSAIVDEVGGVVGPDSELVELVWVPMNEAKDLDLPPVTAVILLELADRIKAGFGHHLPVPFYHEVKRAFVRELL